MPSYSDFFRKPLKLVLKQKHDWSRESIEKDGKYVARTYPMEVPPRSGTYQDYYRDVCLKCGREFYTAQGGYQQPPEYGCK